MKQVHRQRPSSTKPAPELVDLRARLAEAEETIRAIRSGEVDAMLVVGKAGPQVFTLEGAEHAYRVLIESMNEGALTLTSGKTILYANQCFARMIACPLEQVTGSSLRRFLSVADNAALQPLLQQKAKAGSKIQVVLHAADGSKMPAQISVRPLARNGARGAVIGMVVTDMTEARRTEELLRSLTHRVVRVQEAEREALALELHDHITQLLCAILFRCQALVNELSARDGPSLKEAMRLREMLTKAAEEVERISRNLRPSVLDQLGLVAVLHATSTEYAIRTGVAVELECAELIARLPAATELALYRILQEALSNVEQHAGARRVTVRLTQPGAVVHLTIGDDGVGFDPDCSPGKRKGAAGLGLLGMRERATYVGGEFRIKSARGAGTEIEVSIPVPPGVATAA